MSLPIFRLRDGATLPVRPSGDMLKGWLPGTIVNFIQNEDDESGHYLKVDLACKYPSKVGAGGFTINGSLQLQKDFDFRYANNNEKSGFWTADECLQNTKGEQNYALEFDMNHQLQRMGKDLTTINYQSGVFKIYTFEKYDNEYINSDGLVGGQIDWKSKVGTLMGISPRSLFTSFDNNVCEDLSEYRVGGFYKDENGKEFIYAVRK